MTKDTPPVEFPRGRLIDVLRNGGFLRLWLVQALSQTGQNTVNFTLLILVRGIIERHDISQANTAVGLAVLSFSVPGVLLSPVAGVVIERMNKRTALLLTNGLRGLAIAGFLAVDADWRPLLALSFIYTVTFVSGAVGQFFGPAIWSSVPALVPQKDIVHANGLFNLTFTASQLVGFAVLGPLLIKVLGVQVVLVGIIMTFAVCTLLSVSLPSTPPAEQSLAVFTHPVGQFLSDVREAIVFIFQTPILIKAIGYLSLATASYLIVAVLGPEYAAGVLGLPSRDLVILLGPAGLGLLLGALVAGRLTARIGIEATIDRAITAAGAFLIALGVIQPVGYALWANGTGVSNLTIAFAAVLTGFLGLTTVLILAPSQSLLQQNSPEHIRARVYATFFTVSNSVAFIPIIFVGALADLFGVVKVLVAIGVILFLVGLAQLSREERRNAGGHPRSRRGDAPRS